MITYKEILIGNKDLDIMKTLKLIFPFFLMTMLILVGCSSDDDMIPGPSSGFLMGKTVSEVVVGEDVQFNSSTGNAEDYFWDFGDGTKSEEKNPVKPYFESGIYTVTLTVKNQGGSDSFSQEITVLPFADFQVENVDDLSTESEVQFTNLSKGATAFEWNFGDEEETVSTEENPSFAYSADGVYTVSLTAIGEGGTKVISKKIRIGEGEGPDSGSGDDVETPHELFYIDYSAGQINMTNLPEGGATTLVADVNGNAGVGIAYDPRTKKIYWSDFEDSENGKIWRMNADGSDQEELVSGIVDPYSIALNLSAEKIYWGDDEGHVSVANLDGSDVVTDFITIEDGMMRGLDYDSKNDKIYFYEVNEEVIYRADSDGGNVTRIVEGTYGYGIFVDEKNDMLYYDDQRGDALVRSNLDGSNPEVIADVFDRIHGLGIDYDNGKLYWSERSNGDINRIDLDGGEKENILTGLPSPRGLFIK